MDLVVKNELGATVETIQLNDGVFDVPMNHALVHQAMVIYQSNKRQGTHDTKTRAQVSGGGRKPWIQKHTGRARQGSIRSPQWRHGGVVFGPHPRSYRKALPRRMRRQALKCVLSEKARQDRLVCLEDTGTLDGKTRSMLNLLDNLGVTGSTLVVTREADEQVVRAASNLRKVWTTPVNLLNAQDLLSRDTVIITLQAARWAESQLGSDTHGRRGHPEPDVALDDAPLSAESGSAPLEAAMDEAIAEEPAAASTHDLSTDEEARSSEDEVQG